MAEPLTTTVNIKAELDLTDMIAGMEALAEAHRGLTRAAEEAVTKLRRYADGTRDVYPDDIPF